MPTPGQPAPDFTLYNTDKKAITLSELRGKNVLILFFPFAFTSTCTKELCSVRDEIAYYDNANAVVLGISIDTPYTLGKYKAEQNLNMDLLSDFNKEAAFVVDKEGIIRYAEVLEDAGQVPDFDKIKACLASLN